MKRQDVAIVGLACRFPGGGNTPEEYWRLLAEGRDAVTEIPESRWDPASFYNPNPQIPGKSYTCRAGVLDDVAGFDAAFFGISPREAEQMDPQQRLLLEMAWEAMERGGQVPEDLAGSRMAVYVGISGTDYADIRQGDPAGGNAYFMLGSTLSIAANRLSYIFDLHGPSMAVDTACSSSLVALDEAVHAIWAERAETALVGGINMLLSPFPFMGFSKAAMLAPYGQCRAFDRIAEGYVRAEGGGVLLLKPLDRAIADRDPIHAVVRGVASNADGRTNGIALPDTSAQERLLREVYASCGIDPADIDYFEAHGTGTAVGDPAEAGAIGRAIAQARPQDRPLPIGSAKSNVGHLEPASGMAGLFKAIGVLRNRTIPPSLHIDTPNPEIDFAGLNLRPVTRTTPLPEADRPAIAGVNSFGFGGTNAHVVLQAWPPADAPTPEAQAEPPDSAPLFLSARDGAALKAAAGRLADRLSGPDAPGAYDAAYTLARRRAQHGERLVLRRGAEGAPQALRAFAAGETPHGLESGGQLVAAPRVALLFAGNGAQWPGMGAQLLAEDPVFAEGVGAVDRLVEAQAGWSVLAELKRGSEDNRLDDTRIAQPLLFAVQIGLVRSLEARGLKAAAVAGHSVGEVAAAHAAGVLDLEQAVHVILMRSKAQGETAGLGRMAACEVSETRARREIAAFDGTVEVAAVNGPNSVTLSGDVDALAEVGRKLKAENVPFRLLDLNYAFHNRVLDPVRESLLGDLAGLAPSPAEVPFHSTVTGGRVDGRRLDADYWWDNVRRPVQFYGAIASLVEAGCNLFLEIGPHPITQSYVRSSLRALEAEGQPFASLTRRETGMRRVTQVVDQLWCAGADLNWDRIFPVPGRVVDLPTYPWQRERYWFRPTPEASGPLFRPRQGPLLGVQPARDVPVWECEIDLGSHPYLADHVVGGSAIFPAAGFVELALQAAAVLFEDGGADIEGLEIRRPLAIEAERTKVVRVAYDSEDRAFRIESRTRLHDEPWSLHAKGRLSPLPGAAAPADDDLSAPSPIRVDAASHYAVARGLGLDYGPAFQTVQTVRADAEGALVDLAAPEALPMEGYQIPPPLLDGCLQALFDVVRLRFGAEGDAPAYLPQQIGRLTYQGGGTGLRYCRIAVGRVGPRSIQADFRLLDAEGRRIATVEGVRFVKAELIGQGTDGALYHDGELVALVPNLDDARPAVARPAEVLPGPAALPSAVPDLDDVAAALAWDALAAIGAGPEGSLEALSIAAGVPVERLELLTHCMDLAATAGLVTLDADGRWARTAQSVPDPAELWRTRLGARPDCLAELTLLARTGRHLPDLLRGAEDATAAPTAATAAHLASDSPSFGPGVAGLIAGVRALIDECPADRRLRIAEVHGGGAVLGQRLLAELPGDAVEYVLASSSEDTVAHAQVELGARPEVTVVPYDPSAGADGDPVLRPGAFDLVIGAGALECYGVGALDGLAELLASDGLLLVCERRPSAWLALCDASARALWTDGALLDAGDWQRELERRGWREPAAQDLGHTALLAARAPAREPLAQAPLHGAWILLVDEPAADPHLVEALTETFSTRGGRTILVQPAARYAREGEGARLDPSDQAHWAAFWRDLAADEIEPRGVLHLLGLDPATEARERRPARQEERAWVGLTLVRSLAEAGFAAAPTVLFATAGALQPTHGAGPQDAALLGLARVLRNEFPDFGPRVVDLSAEHPFLTAEALADELVRRDAEVEVVLGADGRRLGLRMRPRGLPQDAAAAAPPAQADRRLQVQIGALERLHWAPAERRAPEPGEVEIRVEASGLNFRDVMFAMGVLPEEMVENGFSGPTVGMECAGTVVRVGPEVSELAPGDRVMGFAPGCFAGHVTTPATAIARLPGGLDFAAGATVPTVFFTVYYALGHLARLEAGERVLIHGAAGGVGQAAIQYARHLGAEIFATAGTPEKRDVVRLLGVPEAQILDSRSLDFADRVAALTDGAGVDVILNSLAGEAVHRNLTCLAPFGRFVELGKRDFFENSRIGLKPFRNNISYFGVDADQVMLAKPALTRRLFAEVGQLFERGVFRPLPYRVYAADAVVQAFRDMQQSKHIGKLVIRPPHADAPAQSPPAAAAAPPPETAQEPETEPAAFAADPAGRYLVTGGLRGFGLATARWLADKGARDLVLVSRSGPATPEARTALAELDAAGVRVDARACDVADASAVAELVAEIDSAQTPLKGVIHAAAVFDDAAAATMTAEQFARVFAPKATGAWALHRATVDAALDFFVVYSSVTTAFGNPGQANYVAANAVVESLIAHRRAAGLPGLAVGWGAISDAGYLTRNAELGQQIEDKLGARSLTTAEALAELERLLAAGVAHRTVARLDWRKLSGVLPGLRTAAFADLTQGSGADAAGEVMDLQALVADMSPAEVKALLVEVLTEEVGHVLRLPPDKVDPNKSVFDLGMDSLMAVELRTALEQRLGVELPAMALGEGASITRLAERIREGLLDGTQQPADGISDDTVVRAMADRHSEDIDADELREIIQEAEAGGPQRLIQGRSS